MATNWTRPELALVVEALHEGSWSWLRASGSKAQELSALLRNPLVYPEGPADPKFRSVNAIQRKGENLRTNRQGYKGQETHGGALDLEILADYETDPVTVLLEAVAARELFTGASTYLLPTTEDDEVAVNEGKLQMRQHLGRERSRGLRARKIKSVTDAGEPIICQVCNFDFADVYGSRGDGYIEVHHVRPLHDSGPVLTTLADLALVCANCHRMIHRTPWVSPSALKASIRSNRPGRAVEI